MDGSPSGPFRIVVVDDESRVRRGLQIRLDTEPDLQVVASCATGEEAIELVRELRPDLVLMDVRLPTMDGFDTTMALRRTSPAIPVVMLTLHDTAAARRQALQAGAAAFVSKHDGDAVLLRAVRQQLTDVAAAPTRASRPSPRTATP